MESGSNIARSAREPDQRLRRPFQQLDHRKVGALRVFENRELPDVLDIRRRDKNFGAQALCFFERRFAILDGEVDRPVWRYRTPVVLNLDHPPGRLVTLVKLRVLLSHSARDRLRRPSEQPGVKLGGGLHVLSVQLVPAERARFVDELGPDVQLRLPQCKHCAGRVSDDGHPADVHHVEGRHGQGAAEIFGLLSALVRTLD